VACVFNCQGFAETVDLPLHISDVCLHSRSYPFESSPQDVVLFQHLGCLEVGFFCFHSVYRMVNQTRQRTGWSWVAVLKFILGSRSAALRVRLHVLVANEAVLN